MTIDHDMKDMFKLLVFALFFFYGFLWGLSRIFIYYDTRHDQMIEKGYVYCYTDTDHSGFNLPENCIRMGKGI